MSFLVEEKRLVEPAPFRRVPFDQVLKIVERLVPANGRLRVPHASRHGQSHPLRVKLRRVAVAGLALLLLLCALGTRTRNEVWHTQESLWRDAIVKSPGNSRALMYYGIALIEKGDPATALPYLERAESLAPNYATLEINLGIAYGNLNRDAEAERHFRRAIRLDPKHAEQYIFYGRWLNSKGRSVEAVAALNAALSLNPAFIGTRYLLLQIYSEHSLWGPLKSLADEATDAILRLDADAFVRVAAIAG